MKTLLIHPDSPRRYGIGGACAFPLGLGYIAAVLEEDHDVKVIDVCADRSYVSKILKEHIACQRDHDQLICDILSLQLFFGKVYFVIVKYVGR